MQQIDFRIPNVPKQENDKMNIFSTKTKTRRFTSVWILYSIKDFAPASFVPFDGSSILHVKGGIVALCIQ